MSDEVKTPGEPIRWPEDTPVYAHEQVVATTPGGREIYVDAGLKDLLEALWKRPIGTEWSCQGGCMPGSLSQQGAWAEPSMFHASLAHLKTPITFSDAHIVFSCYEDAVRFLKTTMIELTATAEIAVTWSLALKALPPYPIDGLWRGQVIWHYGLTKLITRVWCE